MTSMPDYVSTTNACKLCTPMGAALAFRGIAGCVPFLHGSQGCATYMRRYIISHFNEPIDIASSALGEKNAVFGGGPNLKKGLVNVIEKYRPGVIGIATTCLTETIGDDVAMILEEFRREVRTGVIPEFIHVATPSYSGTHMEGFHAAALAAVKQLGRRSANNGTAINILPGFLSPADIRCIKEMVAGFGLCATVLPDISETLDGPALSSYPLIPEGGTPLAEITAMPDNRATIEFAHTLADSAGTWLENSFGVKNYRIAPPVGIRATDEFCRLLRDLGGRLTPEVHAGERGRLVDALVDSHKYVSGKRAVVYGEEDLVVSLTGFLAEIGVRPVLCASGGKSGRLAEAVRRVTGGLLDEEPEVYEDTDFYEIAARAEELGPDLMIGHSKGYPTARKLAIPLIRVGFPIHDRMGGQRVLHVGYAGAQQLFDRIVNGLIAAKQEASPVGYSYM